LYITIRNQVKTSIEITKPTLKLFIGEDKVAESQPDLKKYKIVTGDNALDAVQFEIDPKDRIFWAALLKLAIHSIQNITQILNPNFKAGINLICKGTTYIKKDRINLYQYFRVVSFLSMGLSFRPDPAFFGIP